MAFRRLFLFCSMLILHLHPNTAEKLSSKEVTSCKDGKSVEKTTQTEMLKNATETLTLIFLTLEQLQEITSMLLDIQSVLEKVDLMNVTDIDESAEMSSSQEDETEVIDATDCTDIAESYPDLPSGPYWLKLNDSSKSFEAFCDMDTDGGGWTVFQRRLNGSVDFYREWDDYKHGFGDLEAEHWLGLGKLHNLTSNGQWELRVELEDHDGNSVYAKYSDFYIGSEETSFKLHIGTYNGTAKDSLRWNDDLAFTTKDHDQDQAGFNCAQLRKSAWWYKYCTFADLNSVYSGDPHNSDIGLVWFHFTNQNQPRTIKKSEMKARPVQ